MLGRLDKVLVLKFVLKPIKQPIYRVQYGSWPNHKNLSNGVKKIWDIKQVAEYCLMVSGRDPEDV